MRSMKQTDIAKKFGDHLRKLREATGRSQETMAATIGLDRSYYASIECGKRNVALRNIKKIAKGFKLSLSKLFEGV